MYLREIKITCFVMTSYSFFFPIQNKLHVSHYQKIIIIFIIIIIHQTSINLYTMHN